MSILPYTTYASVKGGARNSQTKGLPFMAGGLGPWPFIISLFDGLKNVIFRKK